MLKAPTEPDVILSNDTSGACTPGDHSFKVTYLTPFGETDASPASVSVRCDATHRSVVIQAPTGSNNLTGKNTVAIGRNIYATRAGDSTYYLISQAPVINGNADDNNNVPIRHLSSVSLMSL